MSRSSAIMPGNAALCEPVDLQSEHPSMSSATFDKHSTYITYILHSFFKIHPIILILIVNFLITPVNETFIL